MARSKARVETSDEDYEKQSWNIYSMMLLLALLALIIGCIFLIAELRAYDWNYSAKGVAAVEADKQVAVTEFSKPAVGQAKREKTHYS